MAGRKVESIDVKSMLVNATQKRKLSNRVKRGFTERIGKLRFERSKPTYWIRPRGEVVDFVHLHLFSFSTDFRVHSGIRVLNDPFEAIALNGLTTNGGWFQQKAFLRKEKKYLFHFSGSEDSVERCAMELYAFTEEILIPWFDQFNDTRDLLSDRSPLGSEAKQSLRRAIRGEIDEAAVANSKKQLGLS